MCIVYITISDIFFVDNVKFAKTFNDVYVLASMWNLESLIKSTHILRKLLQNNYHNLGVYVDARCDHNYTIIYSEVKKIVKKIYKRLKRDNIMLNLQ